MPEGGRLLIETSNFYMDDAFVRKYPYPVQTGNYVLLKVADTGTGMDAATQARMFEPFFTTKSDGMGMGLSICRSIIEAHGGKLWVSPRPLHGTVLRFTVPVGVEMDLVARVA